MIYGGCLDKVDERTIPYELLAGGGELPTKFLYKDTNVVNQSLDEKYWYACVFFGESNIINELRFKNNINVKVTGEYLADEAIKEGVLDIKLGAYLIDGPKISKKLGLINGYAQVNTIEDIKTALVNQGPIGVGSNSIDWKLTNKVPFLAIKGNSYGHKFSIVGYNDNLKYFICENSYGTSLFNKGRFYLRYEDIGLLFNTKTVNFINDGRFDLINKYITLAKTLGYETYYDLVIDGTTPADELNYAKLVYQMIFGKKVISSELQKLVI